MLRDGARVVAIYGPPGAGKTTAARALAEAVGAWYVSSGDVARAADPGSIERGEMADRSVLRAGFLAAMDDAGPEALVIVDGLPRDPTDVELLPLNETLYVLLNVAPYIGIDRQVRRGRPADTFDLADKRTTEQRALMGLDEKDGWAYRLAGFAGGMQTNDKRPEQVIRHVIEYVRGERKTLA